MWNAKFLWTRTKFWWRRITCLLHYDESTSSGRGRGLLLRCPFKLIGVEAPRRGWVENRCSHGPDCGLICSPVCPSTMASFSEGLRGVKRDYDDKDSFFIIWKQACSPVVCWDAVLLEIDLSFERSWGKAEENLGVWAIADFLFPPFIPSFLQDYLQSRLPTVSGLGAVSL